MRFLYSVIIPHYNTPDLLVRCVSSIPRRDDLQIIVVDDCSPGATDYLSLYPELDDPRILLLSTPFNQGAGAARNIGMMNADSDFVIFADADDFFNPCIDTLLDKFSGLEYDIAFFSANSVDSMTGLPANRADGVKYIISIFESERERSEFALRYLFGTPWCRIIKLSLLKEKNIRFDETFIHNDFTFSYMLGHYAGTILVDESEAYCLTDRTDSVSKQRDDRSILTRIDVFSRAEIFYSSNGIRYYYDIHYSQLAELFVKLRFRLFSKGVRIANGAGLPYGHIFRRTLGEIKTLPGNSRIYKRLRGR